MRKNQLLKRFLFISLSILMSLFCFAQVTQKWVARYNSPSNGWDRADCLAVDAAGNVYVTGFSIATEISDFVGADYLTVKYNKDGVEQWVARYNGPGNDLDVARSIAVDKFGNVYVTGTSRGEGPLSEGPRSDYATIKYNSMGIQQWVRRFNGTGNWDDDAFALVLDSLGNVYVTGQSTGIGSLEDYVTIKYNSSGVQYWVKRYNGPGNGLDFANSIDVDGTGNVYVTGGSIGMGSSWDYATIKYNAAGLQQWVRRYNGTGNSHDYGNDLTLDAAGNIYVTGESTGSVTSSDYATIKYNSAGVQQWVRRYNGPASNSDLAHSLAVDAIGNVYVTGQSEGTGTGFDYATVKYNSSGIQLWLARYNGPGNGYDNARFLSLDASANVYVTGTSENITSFTDITTIKYNTSGTNLWLIRYNGPANGADDGKCVAVDNSGFVYVTGYSDGIGTTNDYATIKYSQSPVMAARVVPEKPVFGLPSKFSVSNFPNPVASTTRIQYEIPFDGQVSIKVYDVAGREVKTLVNGNIKTGHHNIYFDASALQNGVYYYKALLQKGEKELKQTGKMIVIK